jgi:hypothetical protein
VLQEGLGFREALGILCHRDCCSYFHTEALLGERGLLVVGVWGSWGCGLGYRALDISCLSASGVPKLMGC